MVQGAGGGAGWWWWWVSRTCMGYGGEMMSAFVVLVVEREFGGRVGIYGEVFGVLLRILKTWNDDIANWNKLSQEISQINRQRVK